MAKTARYKGDKLELFAETRAAVEIKHKIAKSDEMQLGIETAARWYTPEGLAANDTGDVSTLRDKSLHYSIRVALVPDGDAWVVKVTPVINRYNRGIPKPEPVKEGDASLPGWVEDKVNTLALDIYKRLQKFEVKSVPGQVPPPDPAATPPAAPAEGSAAAPADGSAAAPAPATP